MKIITVQNYDEMSDKGAEIIIRQIQKKPDSTLGLATGSTPVGLYERLCKAYRAGIISFSKVKTVNLDEYSGLGGDDAQSYSRFMKDNLFGLVDIDADNAHIPNGRAENIGDECERYGRLLKSLPRDIQLLGLGANGHIGFNEPYTDFKSRTREVALTEKTILDNSRLFSNVSEVPRFAITMGIADIMQAERILLLASGENKAAAVRSMVYGEVSEVCPASVLRLHSDCTVIVDVQAAKLL